MKNIDVIRRRVQSDPFGFSRFIYNVCDDFDKFRCDVSEYWEDTVCKSCCRKINEGIFSGDILDECYLNCPLNVTFDVKFNLWLLKECDLESEVWK